MPLKGIGGHLAVNLQNGQLGSQPNSFVAAALSTGAPDKAG